MISIRPQEIPFHHRTYSPMSNFQQSPQMASLKKAASSNEAYSSESESKPKASLPGAKRRPSRAGTRSVSTLTAAQLERKRANDREAQRAIRQRTKDHIESLERRIQELTSGQDSSVKLLDALQRVEELEQENAMLRSRLSHAVAAIGVEGSTALGLRADTGILPSVRAPSPAERMQMMTQSRTASNTPTAQNIPSVGGQPQQSAVSRQQEHWQSHGGYSPASSATMDAPSVDAAATSQSTVRWITHRPMDPEVSSQGVDTMYPYMLDSSGRPVGPVQYQPEAQQQIGYPPVSNGPPTYPSVSNGQTAYPSVSNAAGHPTDYRSTHLATPMATPSFPAFPQAQPQGYMTAAPHAPHQHQHQQHQQHPHQQAAESMQMMRGGQMGGGQMENQGLMYNMHPSMKHEG